MSKQNESMEKLAGAMEKLATSIEKWQDPVLWQKIIQDALRTGALPPHVVAPLIATPPPQIEAVTVRLSDEDRNKMADKVYEAIKPHLVEFNEFVKTSLQEMPLGRLKDLAKQIEEGKVAKLERRQGCVYITTGVDDFYLGL